jgi:hypothetical protein
MRRTFLAALLIAPLTFAGIAPASASDFSSDQVATAFSTMMSRAEARQLSVNSRMQSNFGVARVDKGTPDAPCLCTITGGVTIKGDGAKRLASVAYLAEDGTAVGEVSQEVHIFASPAQARRAYAGILEQAKKCDGEHMEATVSTDESAKEMTVQLSHGTKSLSDKGNFLWVRTVTTKPGEGGFASYEYVTVHRFGRFIQIVEVENEGVGARAITPKEIARADQLTDSLSNRWLASFR